MLFVVIRVNTKIVNRSRACNNALLQFVKTMLQIVKRGLLHPSHPLGRTFSRDFLEAAVKRHAV